MSLACMICRCSKLADSLCFTYGDLYELCQTTDHAHKVPVDVAWPMQGSQHEFDQDQCKLADSYYASAKFDTRQTMPEVRCKLVVRDGQVVCQIIAFDWTQQDIRYAQLMRSKLLTAVCCALNWHERNKQVALNRHISSWDLRAHPERENLQLIMKECSDEDVKDIPYVFLGTTAMTTRSMRDIFVQSQDESADIISIRQAVERYPQAILRKVSSRIADSSAVLGIVRALSKSDALTVIEGISRCACRFSAIPTPFWRTGLDQNMPQFQTHHVHPAYEGLEHLSTNL